MKEMSLDMDMRDFTRFTGSDIERNKAPMCFELAGKKLDLAMDDGAAVSLAFAAFPAWPLPLFLQLKSLRTAVRVASVTTAPRSATEYTISVTSCLRLALDMSWIWTATW